MKIKFLKLIDLLLGRILCLLLGYTDYLFGLTAKDICIPTNIKKILIVRPGGMGDFLYLLPALKILKKHFPAVSIHIILEKRNKSVCGLTDTIDHIYLYDEHPLKTLLSLLRERYDLVIDTEQFHSFSAVFSYLTRSKIRIGFKTNPYRNHLYTHLIDYSIKGHEAREFMGLLEPLGLKTEKIVFQEVIYHQKIKDAPLPESFIDLKNRFDSIVIVSPRGDDRYRYWSYEKYCKIVIHLISNHRQAVVLTGGKSEMKLAEKIVKYLSGSDRKFISLVGKTTLLELSHVMQESNLFIGCDSGTAVLACTLGIKSIVLFGLNYEEKWGLEGADHLIVRKTLPCSPCYILGRRKLCRNVECMEGIKAKEVIALIRSMGY